MISVLIPVYNYNIAELVNELHKQLVASNIDFEIICLDDKSNQYIIDLNLSIGSLSNTIYKLSDKNNGIAVNREILVNTAIYDWIILIDADVELIDDNYISNYLQAIKNGHEVVFGGISYKSTQPDTNSILRWKYGKQCEELEANKRNSHPYKVTSAANLCIKKDVYKQFGLGDIGNSYGMDIFFGPQLKLNKVPVIHIDNSVYHLGLESSSKYLGKVKFAVSTLLKLHCNNKVKEHENDLLKTFLLMKKTGLNYICSGLYKVLNSGIKKQLLSKKPKITLLQLYKILYMCYYDLNKR
ncbi:glycosyltransferase family 2 protein [Pontimicrobium sp. SW4]|uniref:Glycosyltransferase family 2 protein n=1 Tax=Pontimicrobium sp. SW4 TaxID=3153519 RepID=A0AAU7BQJ6_9FLAO